MTTLAAQVGLTNACDALEIPRSTLYRWRGSPRLPLPPVPAVPSARALSAAEQATVRALLNSARFQDQSPREVYAALLDEGNYYCHWRTMYRLLAANAELRERRDQLRHPVYAKPELLATGPNQVWSWDITKLLGPVKWQYFYLYVVVDIFSRYVVGWCLADVESSAVAHTLIAETCTKQQIAPDQLTLHADNGGPMVAKTVAQLLTDLDVAESHSRPHVANDNPFSEAQFKTLKYHPGYPTRFQDRTEAFAWARTFFPWYNTEHHHTALGLLTPAAVHFGQAAQLLAARQRVLDTAYQTHPERFPKGRPVPTPLPEAVWINPPKPLQRTGAGEAKTGTVSQETAPAQPSVDSDALH